MQQRIKKNKHSNIQKININENTHTQTNTKNAKTSNTQIKHKTQQQLRRKKQHTHTKRSTSPGLPTFPTFTAFHPTETYFTRAKYMPTWCALAIEHKIDHTLDF